METDWQAVRSEFAALERWTYLNTATFGQLPRRALDAVARHFGRRDELACTDFLSWFDDADELRGCVARLIHAEPSDIAFVPNAATALGLLMSGLEWKPGDSIVTFENEFPNNLYYPALRRRAGVRFVETGWDGYYDAVQPGTRLVILSEVNYTNGFRPPLAEVARHARACGALLYVDGTQSLGALRFDVGSVEPDMYAVHAYKWMISPNGAGFMYVAPRLRERLEPNVIGWRSHRDWRRVDSLHHGAPEFRSEAERYEGGMLSFAVLYAMQQSVGMILEIGPEAIERRVLELAGCVRSSLRRLGARLLSDEAPHFDRSAIVAAGFPGKDASALARALKDRNVLISARHNNLRISPHFYNSEEDVERFIRALQALL
jgi:selenocysteine lyase/cysteine desulfurase